MRTSKVVALGVFAIFLTYQFPASSHASEIDFGTFTVTVPDSIEIQGQEVGMGPRSCTFGATMNAKPGFVIPLRGGALVSLKDSLNTTIDSGYSIAEVEGLTRLDIKSVFKCSSSSGTLKPPYKVVISPRGIPSNQVFDYESPVTLRFVQSAPSPKPSTSSAPAPTSSSGELIEAKALIKSLQSENQFLIVRLGTANTSIKQLNQKILKICSSKPKPKGC
jgi:hypothetical protein